MAVELDLAASTANLRIPKDNVKELRFATEDHPNAKRARQICIDMSELLKDLLTVDPSLVSTAGRTVRYYNQVTKEAEAIGSCGEKPPNVFKWWEIAVRRNFKRGGPLWPKF